MFSKTTVIETQKFLLKLMCISLQLAILHHVTFQRDINAYGLHKNLFEYPEVEMAFSVQTWVNKL